MTHCILTVVVRAVVKKTVTKAWLAGAVMVMVYELGVGQASCQARARSEVNKAILVQ